MKKPITMIAALLSLMASGQEAQHLPFWLGPKAVFAQHEGLAEFNAAIRANGADEIKTTSFTGGALLLARTGKFDFGLDAAAVSLSNGIKPPGMQIIFSYISGDFNAGYNLFDAEANTSLAPYAGLGISFTQVYFISHDTTITLSETLGGAQNMNYQRPAPGLTAHAGLRFCQFTNNTKKFGFFGAFQYALRLNDFNWKIPDMPIDQFSTIHFSAGVLFRLNSSM